MNQIILTGRLVKDPEVRYSPDGKGIAKYRLAVQRDFKNSDGNYDADFINCVCFGKPAEFVEKYLSSGMKIAVSGRLQTGSYEKEDGTRVFTTDVVVQNHEFLERKGNSEPKNTTSTDIPAGFSAMEDDDCPF